MDIINLLNDKSIKAIEKREQIIKELSEKNITLQDIEALQSTLDDKKNAIILEAIEAVTRITPGIADLGYLLFAQKYITSESNSLKRESSRIIGNIANRFPNDLNTSIEKLLQNSKSDGTVVRWGSAYALARIVSIPQHANSNLFDILTKICEQEQENGVKNQYVNGLKKAIKVRK